MEKNPFEEYISNNEPLKKELKGLCSKKEEKLMKKLLDLGDTLIDLSLDKELIEEWFVLGGRKDYEEFLSDPRLILGEEEDNVRGNIKIILEMFFLGYNFAEDLPFDDEDDNEELN